MGSCYSHKAADRRYTYTTVQMASTKLDDSSRLARPTPYSRGPSAPFPTRKGIPVAKTDHPVDNSQINLLSNSKSPSQLPLQSSIPRFSSVSKQEINENFIYSPRMRNAENSALNVINNNTSRSSTSFSGLITNAQTTKSPSEFEGNKNRITASNKSCSDSMMSKQQLKVGEKPMSGKSIPRLSSHGISGQRSFLPLVVSKHDVNACSLASPEPDFENLSFECNTVAPKCGKTVDASSNSHVEMSNSKSSCVQSDSHDSITDLDSGLGGSLTEKSKLDDGDTLKDIERLDSAEVLSQVQRSPSENKSSENLNIPKSSSKPVLKCPTYKRSLNGKWVREDNPAEFQRNFGMPKTYSLDKGYNTSIPKYGSETSPFSRSSQQHSSVRNNNPISLKTNKFLESLESSAAHVVDAASNTSPPGKNIGSLRKSTSSGNSGSDDKSDELGSETKSPTSEIENRDFLIDDEISDQPNLISVSREKESKNIPALSLQQSVTELHALSNAVKVGDQHKMRDRLGSDHRDSLLICSELGSSCSSIGSDDMMLDYEKRNDFPEGTVNEGLASPVRKLSDIEIVEDQLSELGLDKLKTFEIEDKARKRLQRRFSGSSASGTSGKEERRSRSVSCPLRPPRPMSVSEAEGGSVVLDSSSYRLLSQDLNGVKTLLLRLKGVIQEAETISPFDQNFMYKNLVFNESPFSSSMTSDAKHEGQAEDFSVNADLRRQIALLQQQLEEKNQTIHLLQQQMTKYANLPNTDSGDEKYANATTQTESQSSLTSSISSSINDDGSMETLVSLQETFEEYEEKYAKEQSNVLHKEVEVSRSLNSLCQDLCFSSKGNVSQSLSLSTAELRSKQS